MQRGNLNLTSRKIATPYGNHKMGLDSLGPQVHKEKGTLTFTETAITLISDPYNHIAQVVKKRKQV